MTSYEFQMYIIGGEKSLKANDELISNRNINRVWKSSLPLQF